MKPYCGENTPTWSSSLSEKDKRRDEAEIYNTSADFISSADGDAVIKQEKSDEDNTVVPEIADKTSGENSGVSEVRDLQEDKFDDN